MEINEKEFINGFNSGYILRQYSPELKLSQIGIQNNFNSFIIGLTSGNKEYERDLIDANLKSLKILRLKKENEKEI